MGANIRVKQHEAEMMMGIYVDLVKKGVSVGEAYTEVAARTDRHVETVRLVLRKLLPTIGLGEAILKAGAARLALRVVEKANVQQAIDVLSRKNIGVLEPLKEGNEGGGNILIGFSADSCGAVKVGVSFGSHPQPRAELPEAPALDQPSTVIEAQTVETPAVELPDKRRTYAKSLERNLAKLKEARRKGLRD